MVDTFKKNGVQFYLQFIKKQKVEPSIDWFDFYKINFNMREIITIFAIYQDCKDNDYFS